MPKQRKTKRQMIAKILIRGDAPNSYAKKNGERVHERLLTVLDISEDSQVPDTFEVLDPNLPTGGASHIGKQAWLYVTSMVPRQNGVRVLGQVHFDQVPAPVPAAAPACK